MLLLRKSIIYTSSNSVSFKVGMSIRKVYYKTVFDNLKTR